MATTQNERMEQRGWWTSQFTREFRAGQAGWLELYLELRESGDDHHTAAETVRLEAQVQVRLGRR